MKAVRYQLDSSQVLLELFRSLLAWKSGGERKVVTLSGEGL